MTRDRGGATGRRGNVAQGSGQRGHRGVSARGRGTIRAELKYSCTPYGCHNSDASSGLSKSEENYGEATALNVTKALTLQGAQTVFAILRGKKLIENRAWRIPTGWYAIHSGSQMINKERAERVLHAWPDAPLEHELPHSAIVGLIYIKEHRVPRDCKSGYIWARGPICHVISKAVEFTTPIPCRGSPGLWELDRYVQRRIKALSRDCCIAHFDLSVVR